jgi:branched-subunit amino acid ABC-type transport system permease component
MVDLTTLLQILWTGLATATYGVLLAAAFSLVLKVVKVWNFAQAGMMGIAYYAMYVVIYRLGWPALAGVAISMAVTIAAALAMEVYGLQTFRRRKSPSLTYFIFTLVVSEFIQYLLAMIFGTEPVSLAGTLMSQSTLVGGIVVSRWDISALCIAALALAALYVLLKRTNQGKFMVAVADNPHLSRLYGIDVTRIYALTFVVASVLVVAAMYLFGTRASMVPNTPLEMMLFAVIAALLGGMGNVFGAAGAALFLALLRSFSILVIPSAWQGLILYALLFVTILFFPNGVKLRGLGLRAKKPAAKPSASAA